MENDLSKAFELYFQLLQRFLNVIKQHPELVDVAELEKLIKAMQGGLERMCDEMDKIVAEGKITDEAVLDQYRELRSKIKES